MQESTEISPAVAREELAKFFAIADLADRAPEMFSAFIDAEWHRMLDNQATYRAFCNDAVGHAVGHQPDSGRGTPSWLALYHARYGTLPAIWFANEAGEIDAELYGRYLATSPAAPLITAWDCTPTTGDPDFAEVDTAAELVVA